ncbi:MAG: hypothetical protein Phog2KO_12460 [Phototrophicaceae bacterium]
MSKDVRFLYPENHNFVIGEEKTPVNKSEIVVNLGKKLVNIRKRSNLRYGCAYIVILYVAITTFLASLSGLFFTYSFVNSGNSSVGLVISSVLTLVSIGSLYFIGIPSIKFGYKLNLFRIATSSVDATFDFLTKNGNFSIGTIVAIHKNDGLTELEYVFEDTQQLKRDSSITYSTININLDDNVKVLYFSEISLLL